MSCMGLSGREMNQGVNWNPPLSMKIIDVKEDKITASVNQVKEVLDSKELDFQSKTTVLCADSAYGIPKFIAPLHSYENLITLTRIVSNRNVWTQAISSNEKGAPKIYGDKYKLNNGSLNKLSPTEVTIIKFNNKKGNEVELELTRYADMKLRSKKGVNMKDKTFDLVGVRDIRKENSKPIIWLNLFGQRKSELTLEEVYLCYIKRYDIEHFFRFCKQNLLLQKYQTPDLNHLTSWIANVMLSYWLLFSARKSVKGDVRKWEKYLQANKKEKQIVTPTQVQRNLCSLICDFDQTPFLPQRANKAKGRQVGENQSRRIRHPVIRAGSLVPV